MTTHTTTLAAPQTVSSDASTTARSPIKQRLFRRILGSLIASLLAIAGLGLAAQPASAASFVTGCFKSAAPYNGAVSHQSANLALYVNGSWVAVASTPTDYYGCAAFNITGTWRNYPAKLTMGVRVGTAYFSGQTPYYAYGGSQRNDLGTGIVTCYGCR